MRVKSLFDAGFPVLVSEDRAGYDASSTAGETLLVKLRPCP
jgi:hypothetical protein